MPMFSANEPSLSEEFERLCDAVIDQRATQADVARLEELVFANHHFKQAYIQKMHLHASLAWSEGVPQRLGNTAAIRSRELLIPEPEVSRLGEVNTDIPNRRRNLIRMGIVLAMGCVLVLGSYWENPWFNQEIATISRLSGTKWGRATIPTAIGKRLSTGQLELLEGMAVIQFDRNVEISLEAPCHIEILSENRCRLLSGRLMANVSPGGEGFVVETPCSVLIDRGTAFGVNVQSGGVSDLYVLKGRVDARHLTTNETLVVREGETLQMTNDRASRTALRGETVSHSRAHGDELLESRNHHLQISTAVGKGKDAFVIAVEESDEEFAESQRKYRDGLLLIKNPETGFELWARKAYLGFDLSLIDAERIESARLELSTTRSNMGFGSNCPDATFAVYGLLSEAEDHWPDQRMGYREAPANIFPADAVNPSKTVFLGRFEIPQGRLSGTYGIETPELAEFLRSDTNGIATLIVVCETQGIGRESLVHAFASRRHNTLPAPTLRLELCK